MSRLDARTILYLLLPPMMWAGNAVVGHMLVHQMPPVAMNTLRWIMVAAMLMPLAWKGLRDVAAIRARWVYCWPSACWAWAPTTRCSIWPCRHPRR